MSKKTVAEITLAIAEKREKNQREKLENGIISYVQCEMHEHLARVTEWPYITGKTRLKLPMDMCSSYDERQIREVLKMLGFDHESENFPTRARKMWYISIPMYQKGEKKTKAQLMLYHFNQELNKQIKVLKKEQEAKAREDYQTILQKLKDGEFESKLRRKGESTVYWITVNLGRNFSSGEYYSEKLKQLITRHGFLEIRIDYQRVNMYLQENVT